MIKSLIKYIVSFLIIVAVAAFSFGIIKNYPSINNPVDFFSKSADVIASRVSDLINYLSAHKNKPLDNLANIKTPVVENSTSSMIFTSSSSIATLNNSGIVPVSTITPPVQESISQAPPLVVQTNNNGFPLSNDDNQQILKYTNVEREKMSIAPLATNDVLDTLAGMRTDDLFTNQYFEHLSPDGKSATDLAKTVGYDYLLIGENLALGNFNGDQGIVDAWMGSPGHRANILNGKYTELGVAVKEGLYKGEKVTIAVQIFGLPQSVCAKPEPNVKVLIDSTKTTVAGMQVQAKAMYSNLNNTKNTAGTDPVSYNQNVQVYNRFAKQVNDEIDNLKNMIEYYNQEVAKYNLCVKNIQS